ncbi:oligosaccharide flippase family protein [Runella limosa]|uniref:oligosaccharide flippase family protein n=1 Tax=Runella limosa TaxID=370978 RepID=UPI0012FB5971|nr:oligosaccharide flippase family protein [Runella limosa]
MDLKLLLKYLSNNFILQLLGVIFSGVSIKLLTLPELGVFNLGKSLAGSFQYTHIGFRYSLDRLLPEGDLESNLKNMRMTLIINSVISLVLFIVYCFVYSFNFFFLCYVLGGWFFATFTLARIYKRGIGQLDSFIRLTFISNLLVIIVPLLGMVIGGVNVLFISYLFISLFLLIRYFPQKLFLAKKRYSKTDFFKLLKIGIPIYISNIAIFIGDNIDKFLINYFLGLKAVGEFGIVTLFYSVILMLPSLVVELSFPEYIKEKKSKKEIKKLTFRHLVIGGVLIISAIVLSYFILPFILNMFYSKYNYLEPLIKLIVLALIPYIFISPTYCLLFANDQSSKISFVNIFALLFYFLIVYLLLKNKYGLEYIIYAKICYSFLLSIGLIFLVWKTGLIKMYFF